MRFLVVVASAFAFLVAPAVAQSPATVPPPRDPRLLIIGDSVILGAQGWIAAQLGARGWSVNQTSRESMHTWEANGIIAANRARGGIGDVVVVQLGTNDGSDPALFARWVDEVMAQLGPERVYWVNMRRFRGWVPAANAALAAAAQRHPNLRVVDWDARATSVPSLVYADGYHLNGGGQLVMADLLARTLDSYVMETVGGSEAPTTTTPSTPSSTAPGTTSESSEASEVSAARPVSGPDGGGPGRLIVFAGTVGALVLAGGGQLVARRVGLRRRGPPRA